MDINDHAIFTVIPSEVLILENNMKGGDNNDTAAT